MSTERFQSAAGGAVPEVGRRPARRTPIAELVAVARRGVMVRSRALVGLTLVAGGVVWAIARGLSSYGPNPSGFYDDLAQPPLLIVVIGVFLLFRSRRP